MPGDGPTALSHEERLATIVRHGINAFMPFEAQAGNAMVAVRREYPALGIMGGLDKSALAKGRAEIHRELDRAARMVERPGYVAGFDHLIPPDVPWANSKHAEPLAELPGKRSGPVFAVLRRGKRSPTLQESRDTA